MGVELIPGEADEDLPQLLELPPEAELLEDGRAPAGSNAREAREEDEELDLDAPSQDEGPRDQVILVNATDPEETRVAVVQGGKIVDLQMTVRRHQTLVNDIYRGRIVNIESAIGAAFLDFGQGRNGFLHTSDVMSVYGDKEWSIEKLLTTRVGVDEWDEDSSQPDVGEELGDAEPAAAAKDEERREHGGRPQRPRARPRLPISDLLHKGQLAVVQVTKDAIGDKGPTLTTYISIPGRYLVLMPSMAKTGVSRKIDDEKERKRLRRILESLAIPQGMGIIVRTAGIGKSRLEIERDLKYLLAIWENFEKRLRRGNHPAPLYQESDVAIRTMRDLFSQRTEKVVVDSPAVWEHMREFARELMPEHEEKIVLHDGEKPLFHQYSVEQDFERIFSRRIELPSGGSIVFDQAEALVAIDVNSGRTREDGADFEDIALKTNLEAVPEIARQLRLRDLGGIIVCDFIDMLRGSSRKLVEKALRDALAPDRARSKLGRISQFGLLELTRQRLGPGLSKLLYDACPHCRGSGRQRTSESRTQAVFRRIASAITQKGFTTIDVHARPDIVEHLTKDFADPIARLREANPGKELRFTAVPDQMEDSILRYLRTDGKEVRPGGRRRR
ncbi:MAG: Rne/Rng family ribonuclease [Planctomycetes bacterium]|nr:Rne/Rng family ribonuclease [Planctomycetota bacterium]